MADLDTTPGLIADRYLASMRSSFGLMSRRSLAASEYWAALPKVREPGDLLALQSGYWRRAIDDYGAAALKAFAESSAPGRALAG